MRRGETVRCDRVCEIRTDMGAGAIRCLAIANDSQALGRILQWKLADLRQGCPDRRQILPQSRRRKPPISGWCNDNCRYGQPLDRAKFDRSEFSRIDPLRGTPEAVWLRPSHEPRLACVGLDEFDRHEAGEPIGFIHGRKQLMPFGVRHQGMAEPPAREPAQSFQVLPSVNGHSPKLSEIVHWRKRIADTHLGCTTKRGGG